MMQRVDVALYCNAANAVFTILPRLRGIPVALNVDGIERKRTKWNRFAKAWYLLSEHLATRLPNRIVSDAQVIQHYYQQRYGKASTFIAYGADTRKEESFEALNRLELEPGRYFLFVSRFEPENHPLLVRRAFEKLNTNFKLALVGDAPHAREYIREVRATTNPRIVIPGAIFGTGYRELGSHCFAYIQATEVGGTHPALIENMGPRRSGHLSQHSGKTLRCAVMRAFRLKTKPGCCTLWSAPCLCPNPSVRCIAHAPSSAFVSAMIGRL